MIRPTGKSLRSLLRRFVRDAGGGIAIWAAILVPPIAVLTVGGVELASIASDRAKLQDAADMAALTAARELGFSGPGGVIQRAQANALGQLAGVAQHADLTATATMINDHEVRVRIDGHRMSFFGNLLPPGGFNFSATSNASTLGSKPLCVIGMTTAVNGWAVHLANTARLQANACLVQSNADLKVDGSASMTAGEIQVTGAASGMMTPAALVGAPTLPDPYAGSAISFPTVCNVGDVLVVTGITYTLPAGLHCGNINVSAGGRLTLAPGNHYFKNSRLRAQDTSQISGDGVTLFFDNASQMVIANSASVSLLGSRDGPWAGFIIVGPRAAGGPDFLFDSDNVNRLEGVIYLPASKLEVSGAAQIGEQSNWTVTLARTIEVNGSTQLVINSDYAASDVPVPAGVGPALFTRLRR